MYTISINERTYRILSGSSIIALLLTLYTQDTNSFGSTGLVIIPFLTYYISTLHIFLRRKLLSEDLLLGLPLFIAMIYITVSIGDLLSIIGVDFNNFSLSYIFSAIIVTIIVGNLLFGEDGDFMDNRILQLDIDLPAPLVTIYCALLISLAWISGPLSKVGFDHLSYGFVLFLCISPFLYSREADNPGSLTLLVFSASFSTILMSTSSVDYASNFDISRDVYYSTSAISDQSININNNSSYSTILSIQTLIPWISIFFNISVDQTILLTQPLIFSLGMMIIHKVYQGVSESTISGLAIFFPITTVQFFSGQMALWRQGVAELALFSIIAISVIHSFRKSERKVIVRIFLLTTILSHYSIGYVFLFIFICANLGQYILSRGEIFIITEEQNTSLDDDISPLSFDENSNPLEGAINQSSSDDNLISSIGEIDSAYKSPGFSTFELLLMATLLFTWHSLSGQGFVIDQIVLLINTSYTDLISTSIIDLLLSTQVADDFSGANQLFHRLSTIFTLILFIFGIFGLLISINGRPSSQGQINFISMAIGSLILVVFLIILPAFAYKLNLPRFLQWSIIFISPFSLLSIERITRIAKQANIIEPDFSQVQTSCIFVVGLIVLNSGLFFELNEEDPRWNLESSSDSPSLSKMEILAGQWVSIISDSSQYPPECIASDRYRQGSMVRFLSENNISYADENSFMSAGITLHSDWNIDRNLFYLRYTDRHKFRHVELDQFWDRENSIVFDGGDVKIFFHPCSSLGGIIND